MMNTTCLYACKHFASRVFKKKYKFTYQMLQYTQCLTFHIKCLWVLFLIDYLLGQAQAGRSSGPCPPAVRESLLAPQWHPGLLSEPAVDMPSWSPAPDQRHPRQHLQAPASAEAGHILLFSLRWTAVLGSSHHAWGCRVSKKSVLSLTYKCVI